MKRAITPKGKQARFIALCAAHYIETLFVIPTVVIYRRAESANEWETITSVMWSRKVLALLVVSEICASIVCYYKDQF